MKLYNRLTYWYYFSSKNLCQDWLVYLVAMMMLSLIHYYLNFKTYRNGITDTHSLVYFVLWLKEREVEGQTKRWLKENHLSVYSSLPVISSIIHCFALSSFLRANHTRTISILLQRRSRCDHILCSRSWTTVSWWDW